MGVKYDTTLPETFYPDVMEAQRRLQGTVVMYKGEGYYVSNVKQRSASSPILLDIRLVDKFEFIQIPITDKGFNNFAAFPLGFCNFFNPIDSGGRVISRSDCMYVSRTPSRAIPQGLHSRNAATSDYTGMAPAFDRIRDSTAFAEMLRGEYPTYSEAYEKLEPDSSIAIDREYALRMNSQGFVTLFRNGFNKDDCIAIAGDNRLLVSHKLRHFKRELSKSPALPSIVEILNAS